MCYENMAEFSRRPSRCNCMMNHFLLVLSVHVYVFTFVSAKDYCDNQDFVARCNETEVILMEYAAIGRMKAGASCIPGREAMGCQDSVLIPLDQECSGRRQCSVQVRDLEDLYSKSCSREYKVYMEANYSCIPVYDAASCTDVTQAHPLPDSSGFLSSIVHRERDIGTRQCPWSAAALPGQRIEIIFYDFKLGEVLSVMEPFTTCPVHFYAVEESGDVKVANICTVVASNRQKVIYTSEGSSLVFYLEINGTLPQEPYFLLKYQTTGCPDIVPPEGATVTHRDEDSATVKCTETEETWYFVCKDVEWLGDLGNCTTDSNLPGDKGTGVQNGFPWGILIAVVIGIAIGCVVGGTMLCLLFLCRRCLKNRRLKKERDAGRDLSSIEIPTVGPSKQLSDPHQPPRDGIYSRAPGLVTVPGMANTLGHAHGQANPSTSYGAGGDQGHYGWAGAQGPMPRHGSLPRDSARLHQQGSLPRPGLTRRLSSEEHIYEKTPYDAYSLASGSQSGSIGRHQGNFVNPSPANAMPMPIPSPSGTASTNMTFEMENAEGKRF